MLRIYILIFISFLTLSTSAQVSDIGQSLTFKPYSPWKMSFFNWATYAMDDANRSDGRLSSYNFLAANYKINYQSRISFNQTFFLSGAGKDFRGDAVDSSVDLGDFYVQYSRYNPYLFAGNIGLTLLKARVYVPLNDGSKAKGLTTQFRGYAVFDKPLHRQVTLSYYLEGRYYFVKSRGYVSENEFYVKANKQSEIRQRFTFTERINSEIGVFQSVGLKSFWYYDVPHASIGSQIREWATADVGAYFSVGSGVTLIASLMHEGKIRDNDHDWQPFREDETQYSLMTYVSF